MQRAAAALRLRTAEDSADYFSLNDAATPTRVEGDRRGEGLLAAAVESHSWDSQSYFLVCILKRDVSDYLLDFSGSKRDKKETKLSFLEAKCLNSAPDFQMTLLHFCVTTQTPFYFMFIF